MTEAYTAAVPTRPASRLASIGFGLGLGLGLACTASQPAPTPGAPSPPSAPDPAAETIAPDPAPMVEAAPIPPGPAAFVLYTLEQTVVVPVDGSEPQRAEGLWVQDDRSTPPSLSHTMILSPSRIERMDIPACPCGDLDGECVRGDPRTVHLDPTTLAITPDSSDDCRCVHPRRAWAFPPPDPADVGGQVFEPCVGDSETGMVSLVGGRLYELGWDWNGACYEALSVYDAFEYAHDLTSTPSPAELERFAPYGCTYDPEDWPNEMPPWPLPSPLCRPGHGDDCGCMDPEFMESAVFTLRRGWLWKVEDEVAHAGSSRRVSRTRARPDRCPGINDPCGDPKPFGTLPKGYRREFWVTTDGAALLAARGPSYQLLRRDDETSIQFELTGVHATRDVMGIRQHADAGPLLEAMRRHATRGTASAGPVDEGTCVPPRLAPRDAAFIDTRGGRGWGDRCFVHVRLGDWSSAEAACLRGLEVATEDRVRGALLYNLGRVAEGRGLPERAAERYRESLAARPGNEAVRKRLKALAVRG